jgi:hypothetical protein
MAQPFNYNIASPMAAFEGSFNFAQAQEQKQRAEQAAREKQAQQMAEQQKVQTALQSIMDDRSPENIAKNLLLVPSIKEQVQVSESVLNEAEKTSANQLRSNVISLFKAGNPTKAREILQSQADGYANTVGQERQAAAAKALLKTYDTDPEYLMTTMAIQLAQSDEKLYNNLFKNAELTAFQKNLVAANIDPDSPRGIALAENFAVNQADPLVEIMTPNNTKFVGPRSEYFRRYGENAPQPKTIPSPKSAAERDALPAGTQYYAPDGSLKTKGGQTSTPQSGNFQGQ